LVLAKDKVTHCRSRALINWLATEHTQFVHYQPQC